MNEATINLERLPGEILAIHLAGRWQLGKDVPSAEKVRAELTARPTAKLRIRLSH